MFKNLEAELVRYDIGQKDLATLLGVAPRTISRKMKGYEDWKLGEIENIANILAKKSGSNFSLEYLFAKCNVSIPNRKGR